MTTETDLHEIVDRIWFSMLGTGVHPVPVEVQAAPDADWIACLVEVTGQWRGAVRLACPRRLALRFACEMFALAPEAADEHDAEDVVKELINMIGGNVKAMLSEESELGLPRPVPADHPLELPVWHDLGFECDGQPIRVSIHAPAPVPAS